jgi:hypothetical protein
MVARSPSMWTLSERFVAGGFRPCERVSYDHPTVLSIAAPTASSISKRLKLRAPRNVAVASNEACAGI